MKFRLSMQIDNPPRDYVTCCYAESAEAAKAKIEKLAGIKVLKFKSVEEAK